MQTFIILIVLVIVIALLASFGYKKYKGGAYTCKLFNLLRKNQEDIESFFTTFPLDTENNILTNEGEKLKMLELLRVIIMDADAIYELYARIESDSKSGTNCRSKSVKEHGEICDAFPIYGRSLDYLQLMREIKPILGLFVHNGIRNPNSGEVVIIQGYDENIKRYIDALKRRVDKLVYILEMVFEDGYGINCLVCSNIIEYNITTGSKTKPAQRRPYDEDDDAESENFRKIYPKIYENL